MAQQAIEIIGACVLALIPILTPFVLGIIKAKMGDKKFGQATAYITKAVTAAEFVGAQFGLTGEDKKQWVIERVSAAFKVDPGVLEVLVENAVAELKQYGQEFFQNADGKVEVRKVDGE